jgi:hypothetical protein
MAGVKMSVKMPIKSKIKRLSALGKLRDLKSKFTANMTLSLSHFKSYLLKPQADRTRRFFRRNLPGQKASGPEGGRNKLKMRGRNNFYCRF